jgi:peroxiredoxin Q/BCP
MTPGCTREACEFRDTEAPLKRAGAVVLGVSPDSLGAHDKFKKEYKLNFPLLSDPDKKVAKKYGAWGEKLMYGKKVTGMIRSTFVIDKEGVCARSSPASRSTARGEGLEAVTTLARLAWRAGWPA